MRSVIASIEAEAAKAIADLHRSNSETALQAIVELLLTDHAPAEVRKLLRGWADYIEERV